MKKPLPLAVLCTILPVSVFAVYAPIPEQEQGKALSFRIGTSVYHDSNIFGAPTGEIESMVYNLSGRLAYNSSVTDQTFVAASYELSLDHIKDRPGDENLASHIFSARLAHAFSDSTNIDFNEVYQISKNPQSLLAGVPLHTEQSLKRNQFDARFVTMLGQRTGLVLKYRNLDFNYDDATLSTQLDRMENLAGFEVRFSYLPETKLVAEYRYQDIAYDNVAALKDKRSHFLLAGADYNPGRDLLLSARAGGEDRSRSGAPDTSSPYLELSARYTYNEGSFFSGGFIHTIEEPSDTVNFFDTRVNRFFVNLQHRLSPLVTASGSFTYEPSELQGRTPFPDVDEKTVRAGAGLSWLPNRNWIVSATVDVDHVNSDLASREQKRTRFGVSARFSF